MRKPTRALAAPILAIGCLCIVARTAGAQSGTPSAAARTSNVLSAAEVKDGWQLLFDGKTLNGTFEGPLEKP